MPSIGLPEIIVVLIILLLLFGPGRLPQIGRSLGRELREFRHSLTGYDKKKAQEDVDRPGSNETGSPLEHKTSRNG
jgi:sec-independent protein translocase protein TatA